MWSLMCPNECPGLADVWGDEFEKLYIKYESEGKFRKQVKAQEVWAAIIESQIETGTPYMLYKDACNRKSNQQNLGTIKCSNLCTEIVEYSSPDEVSLRFLYISAFHSKVFKFSHFGVFTYHSPWSRSHMLRTRLERSPQLISLLE